MYKRLSILLAMFVAGCDGCGDNGGHTGDAGDSDSGADATPQKIGPEIAVDTVVSGNSGQVAIQPAIAFNGTTYLAVWAESRINRDSDIFAARIATDGTITDKTGIEVNTAQGKQTTPVVAWAGDRWVVAWNNTDNIGAATLTAEGVVTQLPALAATATVESVPAIAASGNTALVAWQAGSDVVAAQVAAGVVGTSFAIATTASTETDPAVAATSGGFLVAWTDAGVDVRGRLVASGAPSGSSFEISPAGNDQSEPAATFNGTNYVVTYNNGSDVFAARISPTGTVLDTAGVAIGTGTGTQSTSSVACDGASCMAVFLDSRTFGTTGFDIYGQRFGFDLALQGTNIAVSSGARYEDRPAIAGGTTGWMSLWEDNRTNGPTLVIGSRVSATGAITDAAGAVINTNAASEQEPAVATGSTTSELVVWSDSRVVGNNILGVRFEGTFGAIQDATAKTVTDALHDQSTTAATFDGTNYLVAWTDSRNATLDIYATRFDRNGAALDANGLTISNAIGIQAAPDVASGGGVSLVVWQDRRSGDFDIRGALVTSSGLVSVPDIAIATAADDQNTPAVAYDSANNVFIVVWSDNRSGTARIFGARVSPAGSVLDVSGVMLSGGNNGQFRPDVAVSSNVIMAVWDDRRTDTMGDIYGARLTTTGALAVVDSNGIAVNVTTGQQTSPTIIGTPRSTFVVAWADSRNAATTGFDIYGVELTMAGQPSVPDGFEISNATGDENAPTFANAASTAGGVSIAYQAYRPDLRTTRVFKRALFFQ